MRPFSYSRADSAQAAISAQVPGEVPPDTATVHAPNQFLAGDTTLIDLMKLDVMRPRNITDHQRAGPNAVGRHQVWAARPPSRRLGAHVGRRRTRGCAGKLSSDRAVARARSQPADTQHGIAGRQSAASGHAIRTSATHRTAHATSASLARVAPRWEGSIDRMPFSAPAITASRPMPAISPRRSLHSMPRSNWPDPEVRAVFRLRTCTVPWAIRLISRRPFNGASSFWRSWCRQRHGRSDRSTSRSGIVNPTNSRWPRLRSRSISMAMLSVKFGSRLAEFPRCLGVRAKQNKGCPVSRSMTQRSMRQRIWPSRRQSHTSTTASRFNWAL
jgi:hypothetical protein